MTDRLTALGGHRAVDAVAGLGTTVTAAFPPGMAEPPELCPLDRLNPRELEVLSGTAQGLRNRKIAAICHWNRSRTAPPEPP